VLVGDAAHTAHFSIGSGTKLAIEDAIALARALQSHDEVEKALAAYEEDRRPEVERLQRAAQVSLEWFEETERYHGRLEPLQFAMSLLTRSLRVTHANLKTRDPGFVSAVDRWYASRAEQQSKVSMRGASTPPPMFTPFRLREMLLSNRVVVSPMCQYSAEDGTPADWHLVNLGSRAVGGAALVVAEMTDVSREGRITPGCTGMYKPEHMGAWKRIVDFVHAASPARIALQLAHAGRKGSTRRLWEGMDEPLAEGNWPLISASALPYHPRSQVPKAMDREDMTRVREEFVAAARMAAKAGFDMLELHMAHGYLLASFISPLTNVRRDEYGGSAENRARYPLEVFDAVRRVWPAARPMSVKISATDWAEGGLDFDEAVGFARRLGEHGCDIVTVSTGQTVPHQAPRYGRLYQTPFSDRIRCEAGVPTMTVGGIASHDDVNSILAAGRADLCVLARGHLYDPYWTRHAAYEQGWDLPWPDQYVSVKGFTPRED
jgi:anthraniloyl-CoA monooxygenase